MQSKRPRKLALNKETLRKLEENRLGQARGEGAQPFDETVGDGCKTREWSSCPPCD